jgi:hypothetical protein
MLKRGKRGGWKIMYIGSEMGNQKIQRQTDRSNGRRTL